MSKPIQCPGCGEIMNHHADKIMYTDHGEELEEYHQCPSCGAAASRRAAEQSGLDAM